MAAERKPPQASYGDIGGPSGHLANRRPFRHGHSMSAYLDHDGTYRVMSYSTEIASHHPETGGVFNDRRYSQTTSRQQNMTKAWLGKASTQS